MQTFSGGFFLVWGEKLRGGYMGGFSTEEFVMGEDNFNEGGAGLSSII